MSSHPDLVVVPHRPLWDVARGLIGREPGVVFLDAGGPEQRARWSIMGCRPRRVVTWPQGRPGAVEALRELLEGDGPGPARARPAATAVGARTAPTAALARPAAAAARAPDMPPFRGGWIGWFSYDLGRHFERLPSRAAADPAVPDFALGEYDVALVEDRQERRLWAVGSPERLAEARDLAAGIEAGDLPATAAAGTAAAAVAGSSRTTGARTPGLGHPDVPDVAGALPRAASGAGPTPDLSRAAYEERVERVLRYIRDGDVFQVNLAQRFTATTGLPSADLYGRLRAASPAPHGAYLAIPGAPEVLSVSPELFLGRTGSRVVTRPIKGTRPRSADAATDAGLRAELRDSAKERAELLMIVDLMRNDLGRVARYGSVRVEALRELERHPTVHHAVATVAAELAPGVDTAALLAATFPGGSVTGAPKIRAMEIIDELEPVRRGPYTGAAGWIGADGDLCLSILIRTLVRQGERVSFHVGGGIVADSDPGAEYEETLAKGAALARALRVEG